MDVSVGYHVRTTMSHKKKNPDNLHGKLIIHTKYQVP